MNFFCMLQLQVADGVRKYEDMAESDFQKGDYRRVGI